MSAIKIRNHRDILLAPVVSEKSYALLDENKYTFLVATDANKTEIKIAVESVFDVKVTGAPQPRHTLRIGVGSLHWHRTPRPLRSVTGRSCVLARWACGYLALR